MKIDLTKVQAGFPEPIGDYHSFDAYVSSIESLIKKMIPEDLKAEAENLKVPAEFEAFYQKFEDELPLTHYSVRDEAPGSATIAVMCSSQHTHGIGRYISDMAGRWLIPGKQMMIVAVRSLNFCFEAFPSKQFFIQDLIVKINDERELDLLKRNLPNVVKEIRFNSLAVKHAREIIVNKRMSHQEKEILVRENLAMLLDRSSKEFDLNIYDYVHHLMLKASSEDKIGRIHKELSPIDDLRPQSYDIDLYHEMRRYVLLLRDSFTSIRDHKHLNRIVSYLYLFRKSISYATDSDKNTRHVSLKLLRAKLDVDQKTQPVLGVLVGLNLLGDNELFEEKHLLQAIQTLVPNAMRVQGSYVTDRRENSPIRLLYLEVNKERGELFSLEEVNRLQKLLTREIGSCVETVTNPIFTQRNEEETLRNIVTLSKQLRYVHDIPQVIVNYEKQESDKIIFTVILLRLQKKSPSPLLNASSNKLSISNHEIKAVGLLRKKYPKEANVFQVSLDKSSFIRSDQSLDLLSARQTIIRFLKDTFGDIRDYNGGMISKQVEVLSQLKESLHEQGIHHDFLLENFFYSITPLHMQSMLDPLILKDCFRLLLNALEVNYLDLTSFAQSISRSNHLFFLMGSTDRSTVAELKKSIDELVVGEEKLTQMSLDIYDIRFQGYLFQESHPFFEQLKNVISQYIESKAVAGK